MPNDPALRLTLALKDRSKKAAGRVQVRVKIKNSRLGVTSGSSPAQLAIAVVDGSAGDCAQTDFAPLDCR